MKYNRNASIKAKTSLSGWLSPNGIFILVSNGEYDEKAKELMDNHIVRPFYDGVIDYKFIQGERLLLFSGYIKFTYDEINNNFHDDQVFFPQKIGVSKDVTANQIDWLESNYDKMSPYQSERVRLFLKFFYNRS